METPEEKNHTPEDQQNAMNGPKNFEDSEDYESSMNDITPEELELLDDAGVKESETDDDTMLDGARLDDTDEAGDALNETSDLTGSDLDVPGSETDDDDELSGGEDEENNSYSSRRQDDDGNDDKGFLF